jgi:hypothetical protein
MPRAPKKPSFQFYPGDWMKDPNLSMCSPATRGIWTDLLCFVFELRQGGQVTGTADQIARACRCTVAEFVAAAEELRVTKTANISERDGKFTVKSRRMERDLRKSANLAQNGSLGGLNNGGGRKRESKREAKGTILIEQNQPPSSSTSISSSTSSSKSTQEVTLPMGSRPLGEMSLNLFFDNPETRRLLTLWGMTAAMDEIRADMALSKCQGLGWTIEKINRSIEKSTMGGWRDLYDPDTPRGKPAKDYS